jgi:hypothetical protein
LCRNPESELASNEKLATGNWVLALRQCDCQP